VGPDAIVYVTIEHTLLIEKGGILRIHIHMMDQAALVHCRFIRQYTAPTNRNQRKEKQESHLDLKGKTTKSTKKTFNFPQNRTLLSLKTELHKYFITTRQLKLN